jgi:hypothetical protein
MGVPYFFIDGLTREAPTGAAVEQSKPNSAAGLIPKLDVGSNSVGG